MQHARTRTEPLGLLTLRPTTKLRVLTRLTEDESDVIMLDIAELIDTCTSPTSKHHEV